MLEASSTVEVELAVEVEQRPVGLFSLCGIGNWDAAETVRIEGVEAVQEAQASFRCVLC